MSTEKVNGQEMKITEVQKILMDYLAQEQESFTQKVAAFYREVEIEHGLAPGSLGSTYVITNSGAIKKAEES